MLLPIVLVFAAMLAANANSDDKVSVLVSAQQQEVADSVVVPPVPDNQTIDGVILEDAIAPPHQTQRVPTPILEPADPIVFPEPYLPQMPACHTCCKVRCCCKTVAEFCLIDPDGCEVEFCAKVPACCAGHTPKVSWRCGILGRKIAILCWDCCDDTVKVIVTRRGKVRVRD